jgi:hypothetical protein
MPVKENLTRSEFICTSLSFQKWNNIWGAENLAKIFLRAETVQQVLNIFWKEGKLTLEVTR